MVIVFLERFEEKTRSTAFVTNLLQTARAFTAARMRIIHLLKPPPHCEISPDIAMSMLS